ncbi:MAG: heterodisulfide reductase-related iron-sulfur binding cluster [Nitrospinota bacterium]|nr:heterodisulfide reductase-related iron-sulfur binding cluster [Nitrospinota bacterium]
MTDTREIYWNVGKSVLLPMYSIAGIAILILIIGFLLRLKVYKKGKELVRTDKMISRIAGFISDALLQAKVLKVWSSGGMHALFFWGFMLLLLGTTLTFIQADITEPFFDIRFLHGSFYKIFSLTLDVAGLIAIVMLGGLFVRRFIIRPEGLETRLGDYAIHLLLFTILITGFVLEGIRIAATEYQTNMPLAFFSPVGLAVSLPFTGMDAASLSSAHRYLWWFHFFVAIGFIVFIPFTKLKHMFTTSTNYIFTDRRPKGSIDTLDLEDENVESFGVGTVKDFFWKDIFDADACTECKRCQDVCPAFNTQKPLSPMKVITGIRETAFNSPENPLANALSKDALWSCTTCRACQEVCPASIEHVNKIIGMRRNLVLMDGEFPGPEVKTAVENTEVNGNPFGLAFASRGDWAEGLEGLTLADGNTEMDILYFAGCYASFDKRNRMIAKSFIKICRSAGIKVGILGKDEKCCGEPMRKIGNEYIYQMMAVENIEKIKNSGTKRIVTTCPHCFNTLNRDYRDLGLDIEVEHQATFLSRLIKEGRIKLKSDPFDVTYHDSCYMGRYNDIYDEPRQALKAIGGTIVEMDKTRDNSFCCGGGGGRVMAEEKLGTRINAERIRMASATNTHVLVSNCPFCMTMFEDGVKAEGLEATLWTKDLSEIIAERL